MGVKILLALFLLTLISVEFSWANYDNIPGVIELVGYSNRRARTYYAPAENTPTLTPAANKMQADIETVRQNIEKYNKLLTMDTKNLPESQKDMLERIVERVARLKESLDINESLKEPSNVTKSVEPKETEELENSTLLPSTEAIKLDEANEELAEEEEGKTEPTLVLDETTLLQLQTSMDKLAAAQAAVTSQTSQMKEFPTTTEMMPETDMVDQEVEEDSTLLPDSEEYEGTTYEPSTDTTDPAEQFVAARSNNNLGITAASDETETVATLGTTIGSQRTLTTSGKLTKTRATKRPINKGSNNSKRRPSTQTQTYTKTSTQKHKVSSNSGVTQPSQQYQKISQKPQQQYQQPSIQSYQSQPPKAVSPSSISLDKLNTIGSSSSYGISPVNNLAIAAAATSSSPSLPVNSYGSSASTSSSTNSQDIAYDSHVNTSAIIDSLSNNAREEYYQQKQSVATGVVNKDKVSLIA